MTGKTSNIPADFSADWIERLDGRTRLAQACRARYAALTDDLGGHERLSYQRRSLARRAVWLEAVIEVQEAALARGEDVDQGRMTQAINSLLGVLKTLGLDRVAQEVPDLQSFLKARA
ncbi:hypothetical protein [Halomonas sp. RA08-2]|uniref:hypothetical protein n=1 Tax=Halomonas sp. RA08-2 TaxID=3440842 RepID=UPI003EF0790D